VKVNDGQGEDFLMHRYILSRQGVDIRGKYVDHINHNKLDNRRENLRVTDANVNASNRAKKIGAKSKYRGVQKDSKTGKFNVMFRMNGEVVYVGCYKTEEEAVYQYDMFLVHKIPDFHSRGKKLNFEEKYEEYKATPYVEQRLNIKKGKCSSKFRGVHKEKTGTSFCATIM
jgi:hypothetical protein